jgi:amidase
MVNSTNILDRDASDQLAALARRKVSSVELLELSVARHEAVHGRLNAVVASDVEAARAAARRIDATRARGEALGPLAGLPMTVKDCFEVAGLPAACGSPELVGRTVGDAAVVARTRAAGAIIWGKTNVPLALGDWQTFNGVYGVTNNPWDPSRTPGGSSGGSAAALASGVTALEIGSDIAGSLRVPASFCGVFSHKPTWGAVSQAGHIPPRPGAVAARDLNVVGPMARSARDLMLLFGVIADAAAPPRPAADLRKLRIGLWLGGVPTDPQVRAVVEAYAADLTAAGARLRPIESPVPTEALMAAYRTLLGAVVFTDLPPHVQDGIRQARAAADLALREGAARTEEMRFVRDFAATHAEWLAADEVRARLSQTVAEVFEDIDVIVAPVAPVAAFPHQHGPFLERQLQTSVGEALPYLSMQTWIALATACRLPATVVPAGLTASGLPVGLQIIGPHGADWRTLAVARAYDEQVRGFAAPPLP